MAGDEQGQQNLPEEPRRPRVIPGVGGNLDAPRPERKGLEGPESKLITSELAKLSTTSEKTVQQKQEATAKEQK